MTGQSAKGKSGHMADDTILIVDNEADLVAGLQRTIAMEIDCRMLTAENGLQAIQAFSPTPSTVYWLISACPKWMGSPSLNKLNPGLRR
jgi:hypothetical protein